MPRINLGGRYESSNGEIKNRAWVKVSSVLMNRVSAEAVEEGTTNDEILAEYITGEREFPDEVDENGDPIDGSEDGSADTAEADD